MNKRQKIINIKKPFKDQEEGCHKPVRVNNFYSNKYFEYESKGGRNKILSIKEYLDESKPKLKDINNLKKSDK